MSVKQIVMAAAGLGGAAEATYIEDVFSTYLYTGNGNAGLTINNGIDLSGNGGLTWLKKRSATGDNYVYDTTRGASNALVTNTTAAQVSDSALNGFTSTGFTLAGGTLNNTYASWTFRKAEKFFDVVTYTGTGSARTVAHNLGSVPGCIIIKRTDAAGTGWGVYHASLGAGNKITLNETTAAEALGASYWNSTAPTSSVFTVNTSTFVNASGGTYVAYLFAHDAGGFGDDGEQNVISCGSYTGNGSTTGPSINLGWEPQWVIVKYASRPAGGGAGNWKIIDNMRGFTVGGTDSYLHANESIAEATSTLITPTSTGFQLNTTAGDLNQADATYIYIAIRRGPMKTPESGTEVFSPVSSSSASGTLRTTGFPIDTQIVTVRNSTTSRLVNDRLRGVSTNSTGVGIRLFTNSTAAEDSDAGATLDWNNTGFDIPSGYGSSSTIYWNFRRAPGFFDVVCYTGNSVANTNINHNLGVVPELIIVKCRNNPEDWPVYTKYRSTASKILTLNTPDSETTVLSPYDFPSTPTSTTFRLGTNSRVNSSSLNYVAYLFASCPGVSKAGSYTGTGTTQQINCGFTGGARFVLIKRINGIADWYVWDSARGIVAGNDPYLLINRTAAEVTNTDYIDTYSAGFEISSTAPEAINASGGTFLFLAIA